MKINLSVGVNAKIKIGEEKSNPLMEVQFRGYLNVSHYCILEP